MTDRPALPFDLAVETNAASASARRRAAVELTGGRWPAPRAVGRGRSSPGSFRAGPPACYVGGRRLAVSQFQDRVHPPPAAGLRRPAWRNPLARHLTPISRTARANGPPVPRLAKDGAVAAATSGMPLSLRLVKGRPKPMSARPQRPDMLQMPIGDVSIVEVGLFHRWLTSSDGSAHPPASAERAECRRGVQAGPWHRCAGRRSPAAGRKALAVI